MYISQLGAKAIYDATGNYYWQGTRCIDNSYGEQNISDPLAKVMTVLRTLELQKEVIATIVHYQTRLYAKH